MVLARVLKCRSSTFQRGALVLPQEPSCPSALLYRRLASPPMASLCFENSPQVSLQPTLLPFLLLQCLFLLSLSDTRLLSVQHQKSHTLMHVHERNDVPARLVNSWQAETGAATTLR